MKGVPKRQKEIAEMFFYNRRQRESREPVAVYIEIDIELLESSLLTTFDLPLLHPWL